MTLRTPEVLKIFDAKNSKQMTLNMAVIIAIPLKQKFVRLLEITSLDIVYGNVTTQSKIVFGFNGH